MFPDCLCCRRGHGRGRGCGCSTGRVRRDDSVGYLHAGHEMVVHVAVQQPLSSHGDVHLDSLEDAGEELGYVPVVAAGLEHDDIVAVEMHGVDVDVGAQGH